MSHVRAAATEAATHGAGARWFQVMATQHLNSEAFWQSRADEARTVAEHLHDPDARRVMMAIADKYAARAERARLRSTALRLTRMPSEPAINSL